MIKIGSRVKIKITDGKYYTFIGNNSEGIVADILPEADWALVRFTKIKAGQSAITESNPILNVFLRHLIVDATIEREYKVIRVCSICNHKRKVTFYKDQKFCKECFDGRCAVCNDCDELHLKSEMLKTKYGLCCSKCIDKNYFMCNNCQTYELKTDKKRSKLLNQDLCKQCFKKAIVICQFCAKEILNGNEKYAPSNEILCQDCYDEKCFNCPECEGLFWNDRARIFNNIKYCSECFKDITPLKQYSYIPNKFNYQNDKFEFKMGKFSNLDKALFFGVELEVEHKEGDVFNLANDFYDTVLVPNKLEKKLYFKQDGSLVNGFEIVTHPFTLNKIGDFKWKTVLQAFKNKNYTSYESGRCGFHVHLAKDFFKKEDIEKMRIFFSTNKELLRKFSLRDGLTWEDRYFKYETYHKMHYKDYKRCGLEYPNSRYYALNLRSTKPTIEMRIFNSTLDYNRFMAVIEFADCLSHFIKVTSAIHLFKSESWNTLYDWAKDKNQYHNFTNYVKENKLFYNKITEQKITVERKAEIGVEDDVSSYSAGVEYTIDTTIGL